MMNFVKTVETNLSTKTLSQPNTQSTHIGACTQARTLRDSVFKLLEIKDKEEAVKSAGENKTHIQRNRKKFTTVSLS